MTGIYHFMSNSPVLTFFLALIFFAVVQVVFDVFITKPLRHMNIKKHGWPPSHCDSDGQFKKDED